MANMTLTRKQIDQLVGLAFKFPDAEWFSIDEISTNGIGPTVTVKFTVFRDMDTTVDITDTSTW